MIPSACLCNDTSHTHGPFHILCLQQTVALGSAVQIALFVLPMVVLIGWFTGREMSMKFPSFEVYLYLLSVIIVSLCLSNQRSNWLEGSLLVFTYALIAIGIYYEKDDIESSKL